MSTFTMYLQAVIDGLLIGGVYATIAIGLSLDFGVMRLINWANGELLMVRMYISYFLFTWLGIDPYLIIFLTAAIMFVVGFLLQKLVISNMLAREKSVEPTSVLLFTSGLGLFLSNLALALTSGEYYSAVTEYTGKMMKISEIFISVPKAISFVIAVVCTLALYVFLQKSETGRAIRATSQNRDVAILMGVNMKSIYNIAFGISIAMVGLAGGLLIPYMTLNPNIGSTFGFKAFVIVVLGGYGSVIGALVGGLLVGVIEKVGTLAASDITAQICVFVVFILVVLFRPNGLLGKKVKM